MKQLADVPRALVVASANPTSDTGTIIAARLDDFRSSRGRIRVVLTGGTSVELVLWVHDADGWSRAGDSGNLGLLSGAALVPGTYVFGVADLGMFDHALLVAQNNNGVTVTASIAQVIEREE